jgi:hypothetical protein
MKLISVERTVMFGDESHLYVVCESHKPKYRTGKITVKMFDLVNSENDKEYTYPNKSEMFLDGKDNPVIMEVTKAIYKDKLFGLI